MRYDRSWMRQLFDVCLCVKKVEMFMTSGLSSSRHCYADLLPTSYDFIKIYFSVVWALVHLQFCPYHTRLSRMLPKLPSNLHTDNTRYSADNPNLCLSSLLHVPFNGSRASTHQAPPPAPASPAHTRPVFFTKSWYPPASHHSRASNTTTQQTPLSYATYLVGWLSRHQG